MRSLRLSGQVMSAATAACLMACLALLAATSAAVAAPKGAGFVGTTATGTTGGLFNGARDVAVNNATGDFYVVDQLNHRVQRFSAAGAFERAWGWDVIKAPPTGGSTDLGIVFEICTIAEDCKAGVPGTTSNGEPGRLDDPTGIAIDQSDGSVYVWNRDKRRIEKFDSDGNFILMFGDNVNQTTTGDVCAAGSGDVCKIGVAGAGAGQLGTTSQQPRLDVRQGTGDVFVADPGNRRIAEYQSDGDFTRAFGWDVAPDGSPGDLPAAAFEICTTTCVIAPAGGSLTPAHGFPDGQFAGTTATSNMPVHVAVSPAGTLYAASSSPTGGVTFRFDVTQSASADLLLPRMEAAIIVTESGARSSPTGMEVDQQDNHLFALFGTGSPMRGIFEIDPVTEEAVASHAQGDTLASLAGLGRNSTSADEYVAAGNRVLILNEAGAAPADAAIDAPVDVEAHSATLAGTVTPNGPLGISARYRFEVSKDGINWTTAGTVGDAGDGGSPVAVSRSTSDLEANTFYRARIVVAKAFSNPDVASAEITFLTDSPAPEVTTGAAQNVSAARAELKGSINPNNLPATYRFEYGRTTAYGSTAPAPEGNLSGGADQAVLQEIIGLEGGKLYHYRLVATNARGTTNGIDRTFTTRPAVTPPAGRAYEMVTPADKPGRRGGANNQVADPSPGLPSPDGNAVMFHIQLGLAGTSAAYPFTNNYFVLERGPHGWASDPVLNVVPPSHGIGGLSALVATSSDFQTQAWYHRNTLFPSGTQLSTRLMGDTGGQLGAGWHAWLVDPPLAPVVNAPDTAIMDDQGDRVLRWSGSANYRGLLEDPDTVPFEDPSSAQTDGDAVYLQEAPGAGGLELVNGCTGTGAEATLVPERNDNGTSGLPPGAGTTAGLGNDTVDSIACELGSPTSKRGAIAGGATVSATTMSDDGKRIFFTSPDPATTVPDAQGFGGGGNGQTACAGFSGPLPSGPFVEHVGANTECPPQVYVRQYDAAGVPTLRWASQPEVPNQAIGLLGSAVFEGASDDGRYVYFRTNSPLTSDDRNATAGSPVTTGSASADSWDLYRYELPASIDSDPDEGALMRITGGPTGTADPNTNTDTSGLRFLSDDGQRGYFVTRGVIGSPGDDWNAVKSNELTAPSGTATSADTRNLYLFDGAKTGADRWEFVAQLPTNLSTDGMQSCAAKHDKPGLTQIVNPSDLVDKTGANCVHGTPDGSAIVLETTSKLTSDDDDNAGDIYVYEAETDELTRVTAPPNGATPYVCEHDTNEAVVATCNGDLGFASPSLSPGLRGLNGAANYNVAIDDGELAVYFESRVPLVTADTNGSHMDVYQWRAGELSLMSPGNAAADAYYSGNSFDGEDVFLYTSQRIDPREIDDADFDVYDARVGGGFPLPPPGRDQCDVIGDGCHGGGGQPVGSTTETGNAGRADNVPPGVRATLTVGGLSARARRRAARTGVLALRVVTSKAGRVRVSARARVARKVMRAGSGVALARRAGPLTVRLRLTSAARRHLRGGKALRLAVAVRMAQTRPQSLSVRLKQGAR